MNSEQQKQLKARVAQFFESQEFDQYFERLHSPGWLLWPVALIAPLTIIGWSFGMHAWKKILKGDTSSASLRRRYAKLGREGKIIFTYVVIANQSLKYEENTAAPALVVGSFNDGENDNEILEMIPTLAELALYGSPDGRLKESAKLLSDIDYTFKRRRKIPSSIAGNLEVYAFDLQILGEFLPTKTLKIEAIPCIAEPGKKGLICAIPSKIIFEFLETEETEPAKKTAPLLTELSSSAKKLSHGLIPESLQDDRDRFCRVLLSGNGTEALSKLLDALDKDNANLGNPQTRNEYPTVERMRHSQFLLALITFPKPKESEEAIFGLIILGPRSSWEDPDFAEIPYRYFLLEHRGHLNDRELTKIIDFSHLEYLDQHLSCAPDATTFIDTVLREILKIDDN